jgi:hypothetical protein
MVAAIVVRTVAVVSCGAMGTRSLGLDGAVPQATAADAMEGCIHSNPGRHARAGEDHRCQHRRCWSLVMEAAAKNSRLQEEQGLTVVDVRGGVRDDEQANFCECSRRPAGRLDEHPGADLLRVRERRNVVWLVYAYARAWFRLGCRVPDEIALQGRAGIRQRAAQWRPHSRAEMPVYTERLCIR